MHHALVKLLGLGLSALLKGLLPEKSKIAFHTCPLSREMRPALEDPPAFSSFFTQ